MSEQTAEEFLKKKKIRVQDLPNMIVDLSPDAEFSPKVVVSIYDALLAVKKARKEVVDSLIDNDLKIRQETAKQIFEQLENIFKTNQGDCVPNFHTFLIKDYEKLKSKFLQEKSE